MTFFFDHNLPPALAKALDCLGVPSTYLKNEFPPNVEDDVWMREIADRDYIVVTRDRNIQKRAAQRDLYRQLQLRGLFLGRAFSKMSLLQLAKWFLWRLDDVQDVMGKAKPGEAYLLQQRGNIERL